MLECEARVYLHLKLGTYRVLQCRADSLNNIYSYLCWCFLLNFPSKKQVMAQTGCFIDDLDLTPNEQLNLWAASTQFAKTHPTVINDVYKLDLHINLGALLSVPFLGACWKTPKSKLYQLNIGLRDLNTKKISPVSRCYAHNSNSV